MESALSPTYAQVIAQELADVPESVQREVLNFLLFLKRGAADPAPVVPEAEAFPGLALSEAVFGRYWDIPVIGTSLPKTKRGKTYSR
jgi:hypothetical protein